MSLIIPADAVSENDHRAVKMLELYLAFGCIEWMFIAMILHMLLCTASSCAERDRDLFLLKTQELIKWGTFDLVHVVCLE